MNDKEEMKVAEALARRADLIARFTELRSRAGEAALYQEGDEPTEDPAALVALADEAAAELEQLMARINRTNLATSFDGSTTVTDALARRDVLRLRRSMRTELASAGSGRRDFLYSRSEIKTLRAVDVPTLRSEADDLAAELRRLDLRLQELNWLTPLAD
ncbi:DIP1984 family protein [Tsukamurella ocularis]|uniref:DIP1984 family protein n=1 Tax=Tsukamurella ocularis TaxID=1970234 RepID=UPI0039EEF8DB